MTSETLRKLLVAQAAVAAMSVAASQEREARSGRTPKADPGSGSIEGVPCGLSLPNRGPP